MAVVLVVLAMGGGGARIVMHVVLIVMGVQEVRRGRVFVCLAYRQSSAVCPRWVYRMEVDARAVGSGLLTGCAG